jgi:F-type H+-transporting ATPase subunit epsilon
MSEGKITLEIVTPQGLALREEVDDVAAPSVEGEFGVLPGHLPLLAALKTGIVTFRRRGEEVRVAVGPGFVEVSSDRALLLTDKFMKKDEIDPVRVRLDLKDVQHKLDGYQGEPGSPEWQALVADEVWAAAQLELYGDPPQATQRPFEAFGPPPPPDDDEVPYPKPESDLEAEIEARHPTNPH